MSRKKKKITGTADPSHRNFTMITTAEGSSVEPIQRTPSLTAHTDTQSSAIVQMEPVSTSHPSNSPPTSLGDIEEGGGKRRKASGPCVGLMRGISGLTLFIVLGLGIVCIVVGIIELNASQVQVFDSLVFGAEATLLLGIFLTLSSILGLAACFSRGRSAAVIFVIMMLLCIGYHVLATVRLDQQLEQVSTRGSQKWDQLEGTKKLALQAGLDCCGFKNHEDRAAAPCPTKATMGCGEKLDNFTNAFRKGAFTTLYVAIGVYSFLIIAILYIAFAP